MDYGYLENNFRLKYILRLWSWGQISVTFIKENTTLKQILPLLLQTEYCDIDFHTCIKRISQVMFYPSSIKINHMSLRKQSYILLISELFIELL